MRYELKSTVTDNYENVYSVTLKLSRYGCWTLSVEHTPGTWNIVTLQGQSPWSRGRVGNEIWLDYGQRWLATGITAALNEAEQIMAAEGLVDAE